MQRRNRQPQELNRVLAIILLPAGTDLVSGPVGALEYSLAKVISLI